MLGVAFSESTSGRPTKAISQTDEALTMPVDTPTYRSFRHTRRRHQRGPKCRGSVRKGRRRCQLLDVPQLSAEETAWEAPKEASSPPRHLKKFNPAQVLHPMSQIRKEQNDKIDDRRHRRSTCALIKIPYREKFLHAGRRLRTGASRRDNCFECIQENLARERQRRRPGHPRAHFVRALLSKTFKLNNPTPRPIQPNHPFL